MSISDDGSAGDSPPLDPATVVVLIWTFRLAHAWMHNLPTDDIREGLLAAASSHPLWRDEYGADPGKVPGSHGDQPEDDGEPPGRPRLTLVE